MQSFVRPPTEPDFQDARDQKNEPSGLAGL